MMFSKNDDSRRLTTERELCASYDSLWLETTKNEIDCSVFGSYMQFSSSLRLHVMKKLFFFHMQTTKV